MSMAASAAGFAAVEAIRLGEWDHILPAIEMAVRERKRLLTALPRTEEMKRQGQVWVWIQPEPGHGAPGWEIRGTGVAEDWGTL